MKKYFRAIGHCMAFIAAFWLTGCTYPLNLAGKINVPQITIAQDSKPDIEFIGIRRDSSNVGSTGGTEVVKYNGHYESWSEGFGTFGDGFNIKFSGNNSPVNEIGQKLQQMGVIKDGAYKHTGFYSLADIAGYESDSRYLSYIEVVSQTFDLKDNAEKAKNPQFLLVYSCLIVTIPVTLVLLALPAWSSAEFVGKYNIYIYDTLKKKVLHRVPVEVKQYDKWEGGCWAYAPESTWQELSQKHYGQIVANAIAKKYMEILPQLPKDSGASGNNQTENRRTRRTRRANR